MRVTCCSWLLACALAGDTEAARGQQSGALFGAHYGVPLKWSAVLGFGRPITANGGTAFVAGEPGIGGWRASVGYARITTDLGAGFSARASWLRTTERAWKA